jgi:PAS domain S-box-containing protein
MEISRIPDAALVVNRDGSIVQANHLAEMLFGYERGKLLGLPVEALVPKAIAQGHVSLRKEYSSHAVARPMGARRELQALRADGREFPAEIAIGPDEDGAHIIALIRDVTSSVKTRRRLRDSEDKMRDLDQSFTNTPIGLCYFDKELRFLRINDWLSRINGLSVEEHLGRRIADCLPDVAIGVEPQLRHVLQTGESIVNGFVETATPAHPTTTRTYMHNYFPDRSANGTLVGIFCVVQDVTEAKKDLEGALAEVKRLRDRLQAETIYLPEEIKSTHNFEEIIGNSKAMLETLRMVEQVAVTDATVLLLGETGTGKELLARAIHSHSGRKDRPLIKVDCGTLPSGLIESEMFGHMKGAFTGAHESKVGRFELANHGTIFLDEIGELPLDVQSKLLRVIEDGRFQRLGSKDEQEVDVRIIAATNRDLKIEMRDGRFRADLYYRLSVFPIESSPLRARREDISLLVSFFVSKFAATLGKTIKSVDKASLDALIAYDWPGNIRELRNVIERTIILSSGDSLDVKESLGLVEAPSAASNGPLKQSLQSVERERIHGALEEAGWKIKGIGNAASRLGISPSSLRTRMKTLGITRP